MPADLQDIIMKLDENDKKVIVQLFIKSLHCI